MFFYWTFVFFPDDGSDACNFTINDLAASLGANKEEKKEDITQAWFTTKDDKNAAAMKGNLQFSSHELVRPRLVKRILVEIAHSVL